MRFYTERNLRRGLFGLGGERPKARPGQALVLAGDNEKTVLLPGRRLTPGEVMYGRYHTVYEVDMGSHDYELKFSAPARGGYASFNVAFSAGVSVTNPATIIDRKLNDPTEMWKRVVQEAINEITTQFEIVDGQDAQATVRRDLGKRLQEAKIPFRFDEIMVIVEPDKDAKEYLIRKRNQVFETELTRSSTGFTEASLELERRKAELEADIARDKAQYEIEIQKMRQEVYKPMIKEGLWGALVQQLAQRPDDIERVTNVILGSHNQKVQADLLMLKALLDGDALEDRHLKDVTANLVRNIEYNLRVGPLELDAQPKSRRLADGSARDEEADPEAVSDHAGDDL